MKKVITLLFFVSISSLFANGGNLYKKCVSCHGAKGEKVALGKSAVIKGQSAAKLEAALKGYQAGTYGGPMKAMMKAQLNGYSPADIKAVAEYMSKF